MMIQKKLKGLESFNYIPYMKGFLGNKCKSYLHNVRNAKVTSTRIVYENCNETEGFQRRI